jgi:DNA/RNA endonuclease YhcR with UshA esterase domain
VFIHTGSEFVVGGKTMKKFNLILLLLVASLAVGTQAQMPARHGSNYDPKTEVTMAGTVERVTQETGRQGRLGTHLVLKSENGAIEVHVGPAHYIASQQFSFAAGDVVEVTGSKIKLQNKDVLLAREIKKEGRTLVLRNAQGVPNWSRGRQS